MQISFIKCVMAVWNISFFWNNFFGQFLTIIFHVFNVISNIIEGIRCAAVEKVTRQFQKAVNIFTLQMKQPHSEL